MIVFTVYKYAFYKFMKFAINADKDRKIAFRTPVLVSYITMIFLNFFHFLAVIPFFLPIGFLKNALFFIYLFVVLVVNFYLFIYKYKYKLIEAEFDKLSIQTEKKLDVYFWIFIILSVIIVFIVKQ